MYENEIQEIGVKNNDVTFIMEIPLRCHAGKHWGGDISRLRMGIVDKRCGNDD